MAPGFQSLMLVVSSVGSAPAMGPSGLAVAVPRYLRLIEASLVTLGDGNGSYY